MDEIPKKRWVTKETKKMECSRVDSFVAEIYEVCKKHGMTIEHEDSQGGFIITNGCGPYDDHQITHAAAFDKSLADETIKVGNQ